MKYFACALFYLSRIIVYSVSMGKLFKIKGILQFDRKAFYIRV